MSRDSLSAVMTVVVIGVIALVGVGILGSLGTLALDMGVSEGTAEIDPETGETATLDQSVDESPSFWEISLTQGHAVDLSGGGYVDAQLPDAWDNESWTVCAVGELNDDANTQATHSLVAVENETLRIDYADGEWQAIYRRNDTSSATATIAADTPSTLTPACAVYDAQSDELLLHVDGVSSSPQPLDSNSEQRDLAESWEGPVDEMRVFSSSLDNSTLADYSAEPAAGLGIRDTARYMFEEGSGATTSAFYHDDTATLVDAGWTSGVGSPALAEGEDYDRGINPLSVTPLAGGFIDESPVLYVTWDTGLGGAVRSLLEGIDSAFSLIPIVMLVLLASVIVAIVARMRS